MIDRWFVQLPSKFFLNRIPLFKFFVFFMFVFFSHRINKINLMDLKNIPSSMDTHTHRHTYAEARCSKSVLELLIITSPSPFYHCSPFTSFITSKQHFYLNQPNRAGCCHGIRAVFKTIRLYSPLCYSVCVHCHNRTGLWRFYRNSPKSLALFNSEKTKRRHN